MEVIEMLTINTLREWSSTRDQIDNEASYNWFRHNMGMSATAAMYGVKSNDAYTAKDNSRSKEYNSVNREYAQITAELEAYNASLENPIHDMERKLRDIDRINPNNFEDYNLSMNTLAGLKKSKLDTIVQKANVIKSKNELLLKIRKADMESGDGGGGNNSNPATAMAGVLKAMPAVFAGGAQDPALYGETDMATVQGKMNESRRFNLVTGNVSEINADAGVEPQEYSLDGYQSAVAKYGKDSVDVVYCAQPSSGFGYMKYVTPDGDSGTKPFAISLINTSYVDYTNHTVMDSTKNAYKVEEVDNIPEDIKEKWLKIYPDGVNRLGIKG